MNAVYLSEAGEKTQPRHAMAVSPLHGAVSDALPLEPRADAASDVPADILAVIANVAATSPDTTAVVWERASVSYAALWRAAGLRAQALRALGAAPGVIVGVALPRGVELAVELLAILRTGAAYAPLDTSYPAERLANMVQLGSVRFVLSDRTDIPWAGNVTVYEVPRANTDHVPAAHAGDSADACTLPSDRPLYVIFTSGSTGRPKGVCMGHRAIATLLHWQRHAGGLGAAARTLQFTPVSFDVHVQEFLGTWTTGGTLVLISESERRDPQALLGVLQQRAVERLFLPFVALQQLADTVARSAQVPRSLRDVVTAGEQLVITPAVRALFAALPDTRLHNHYGPSETHVATAHTLTSDVSQWPLLPPIGTPITGSAVLLVNEQGDVVDNPQGDAQGELWLGGACLADGYVAQPELTAQRFVAQASLGERWYRTGDLVRRDAEGQLHYLGRVDDQVKIRGHRVEPGEVEAALTQTHGVANAVVVARGEHGGERQLVAYLVPEPAPPSVQTVNERLARGWQRVWDGTYTRQDLAPVDPTCDLSGWNDSITGQPLRRDDMLRWIDGTRDRVLALRPQHVVEVGAGTGLLLFAIAPHVASYHATDFSPVAARALSQAVAARTEFASRCRVSVAMAHEAASVVHGAVDHVLINSVTQHFESDAYLRYVLDRAIGMLAQGGTIMVGDVTARCWRAQHFAEVEQGRAANPLSPDELTRRVARRLADDRELVIDAPWFQHFAASHARVSHVTVQLKPGGYRNELSRFRFDVILHVTPAEEALSATVEAVEVQQLNGSDCTSAVELERVLDTTPVPFAVRICDIPNARLGAVGVEPDDCVALARTRGLDVQTVPADGPAFDALFSSAPIAPRHTLRAEHRHRPASAFVSAPYQAEAFPRLVQQARARLAELLPEYMQPQRYVLVPQLPFTPSGKVDRRRLPEPGGERPPLATEYMPPQDELQHQLVRLWQEVLGLELVGVDDRFFELGGSSLLSVELAHRMSVQLGREVTVVDLFRHGTVRALAQHLSASNTHAVVDAAHDRARQQQRAFSRARAVARPRSS